MANERARAHIGAFLSGRAVDGGVDQSMGIATESTDRKQVETELRRLNRNCALLSRCNHCLARAADEADLLNTFCGSLVDVGGYRYTWVGYAGHGPIRQVCMKAQAGRGSAQLATAVIAGANAQDPPSPWRTATLTGQPVVCHDIEAEPAVVPWRQAARGLGLRSLIVLPLVADGQSIGTIGLFSAETNAFDDSEVALLRGLAGDLTFGIETARAGAARAQQVRGLREQAEQNERRRIAATLHDGVGQSLQAIHLGMHRLRALAGGGQPLNTGILDPLVAEVAEVIAALREIGQELRPRFLERLALHEAIRFHCLELDKRCDTRIRCLASRAPYALRERVKVQCFLSFREALSNALKHAEATRIEVTLAAEGPAFLTVSIADNGKGFDPAQALDRPVGLGLSMIAERAESVGGRAEIRSTPGEGTRVHIKVPMSEEPSPC